MRRVKATLALLLIGLPTLAVGGAAAAQAPTTVRMAISQDDKNWTPYSYQTGYPGYNVLTLLYDTLLWHDKDNNLVPWLANSYTVSPDGMSIDIKLRDGVKWHDGQALTADDVKFTYDYIQQYNHGRFTPEVKDILDSVTIVSPTELTFRLKQPNPPFLTAPLADVPILPRHIWDNIREVYPSAKGGEGLAVGSGPYKMVEYQPDKFYRFQANPDYFMGKPAVGELDLQVMPDFNAQILALRSGDIDLVARNLTPELVPQLNGAPGINVATGPDYTTTAMNINALRAPFNQVKVRQAIGYAVDVNDIVQSVLAGFGTPGSPGYVHPDSPFYKKGLTSEFNLSKANSLLDEAGFTARDSDGIRKGPDGKRLDFQILVANVDPIRVRAAEVVGQQLGKVGIKAAAVSLTSQALAQRTGGFGGQIVERDFDFAISGATAPVQDDPDRLRTFLQTGANLNSGNWSNPRFDELLNLESKELDRSKRVAEIDEMQDIIATERPAIVLYYQKGAYAYRSAAYGGYTYVKGKGILDKDSFVALPATSSNGSVPPTGSAAGATKHASSSSSGATVWVIVGAVVVVALIALVAVRGRGRRAEQE